MGKELKVTCDSCGKDMYGRIYYTLNIRKVTYGKQKMNPAIYLCPNCFRATKLALLLGFMGNQESNEV